MGDGGDVGGGGAPVEEYGEDEFGTYKKHRMWSMNEIRDHPLFMEDMPRDISDNPHLLALQNIVYDGQTDEQMAEHFRKLGNEAFRSSTNKISSQNALSAYTKGLEMECKDNCLNSQLHSNRAAVSLRLKENDKAVADCQEAIKLDPANLKAYFRGAKASEALGLTTQALKFCEGALKLQPNEAEVVQMQARLKKRLAREESERTEKRRADEARQEVSRQELDDVRSVLEARNIKLGSPLFDMVMYQRAGVKIRPQLAEDDATALQWPLLLAYDENGMSDFVEIFDERCALEEQLQIMFPPERHADWDTEGRYVWDRLVAYLETHAEGGESAGVTRFLPLPTATPLEETLAKATILPLCLSIHILVRDSPALEAFCKTNDIPER